MKRALTILGGEIEQAIKFALEPCENVAASRVKIHEDECGRCRTPKRLP